MFIIYAILRYHNGITPRRVGITMYEHYLFAACLSAASVIIISRCCKKHVGLIYAVIIPAVLFIILSEEMVRRQLSSFDSGVYGRIMGHMSPKMTSSMKFISSLGSWPVLVSATAALYFIFGTLKKEYVYGRIIALNLALASLLNSVCKLLFRRQRPDILRLVAASGYSFPSGHSMAGISFYGLLIYFSYNGIKSIWERYAVMILLGALILLIGISRIYLGVHYASDVLAGFYAGFLWLSIFIPSSRRYMIAPAQRE